MAPLIGCHGHGADLQFIHHYPAAGHRDQALIHHQPHAQAIALAQLLLPLLSCPQPRKAGLIEIQAILELFWSQQLGLEMV
jgi:hypothetical protein